MFSPSHLHVQGEPRFLFFLNLFYFIFKGHTRDIWKFPGQGSNRSCSCQPTPQPQQRRIRGTSANDITTRGNARSLNTERGQGLNPSHGYQLGSLPLSHEGHSEMFKFSMYFISFCSFFGCIFHMGKFWGQVSNPQPSSNSSHGS